MWCFMKKASLILLMAGFLVFAGIVTTAHTLNKIAPAPGQEAFYVQKVEEGYHLKILGREVAIDPQEQKEALAQQVEALSRHMESFSVKLKEGMVFLRENFKQLKEKTGDTWNTWVEGW